MKTVAHDFAHPGLLVEEGAAIGIFGRFLRAGILRRAAAVGVTWVAAAVFGIFGFVYHLESSLGAVQGIVFTKRDRCTVSCDDVGAAFIDAVLIESVGVHEGLDANCK